MKARNEYLRELNGLGRLAPGTAVEEGAIGPENKGAGAQGAAQETPLYSECS